MRTLILSAVTLILAGCAGEPTVQEGPDAETTFDGLVRIDNAAFDRAWADPNADWARYDAIIPGGAEFEFRAVKKSQAQASRDSATEFWIDDTSRARLSEQVSGVFAEELAKSKRFTVTDTVGPNVLIIRGGLHDIVSRVPPDLIGRGEIYLSSVGEATLILEVVDSLSGEVLYRAVERRAAESVGGATMGSSSVTTWAEVRRVARHWGKTLVRGLDALPAE